MRLSSAKYRSKLLTHKYIVCNRNGSPDSSEGTKKRKRTNSRRCECEAHILLKYAGPDGYFVQTFVEEHNHALTTGTNKQFLRCNRKVTLFHQNFIFDHRKANVGSVRSHCILKEMVGSYENIGATSTDFRNFDRDFRARIGKHDADMILEQLRIRREASNNTFFTNTKLIMMVILLDYFGLMQLGDAITVYSGTHYLLIQPFAQINIVWFLSPLRVLITIGVMLLSLLHF